jgi:hypothetical protein
MGASETEYAYHRAPQTRNNNANAKNGGAVSIAGMGGSTEVGGANAPVKRLSGVGSETEVPAGGTIMLDGVGESIEVGGSGGKVNLGGLIGGTSETENELTHRLATFYNRGNASSAAAPSASSSSYAGAIPEDNVRHSQLEPSGFRLDNNQSSVRLVSTRRENPLYAKENDGSC